MKILTRLSDSDLRLLYEDTNYHNMIIEDAAGIEYPYYRIPKLLSLGNMIRSDYNQCFLDKDGFVYSRSYAASNLMKFTGLTFQELFDLTVLHINDTEDRPKCSNCGTPLNWSGRFTAGYGSGGHRWDEGSCHFCSRECAAYYQFNNPEDYPDTAEFINEGGTFGHMDHDTWVISAIKSCRTKFINLGDKSDICCLYATWTESGRFKFGVTSNIANRRWSGDPLLNPHAIKYDTRNNIADLEAYIKLKLNTSEEYLSDDSDIESFWTLIKNLKMTNWDFVFNLND